MRNRFLLASCAVVVLAAAPSLSRAQMMFNPQSGGGGVMGGQSGGDKPPPKPELPPGLPGAAPAKSVAPPTHIATDMEPTDALFDAINRGDMSAARDAISRGADLHGRNVLGMTPLELSVDLGRNDISFMLLSMRGGDDSRVQQAQPAVTASKATAKGQARHAAPHTPTHVAAQAHAPPQTPRLFAGDGGTPNPNAGFLGFGSGQR